MLMNPLRLAQNNSSEDTLSSSVSSVRDDRCRISFCLLVCAAFNAVLVQCRFVLLHATSDANLITEVIVTVEKALVYKFGNSPTVEFVVIRTPPCPRKKFNEIMPPNYPI